MTTTWMGLLQFCKFAPDTASMTLSAPLNITSFSRIGEWSTGTPPEKIITSWGCSLITLPLPLSGHVGFWPSLGECGLHTLLNQEVHLGRSPHHLINTRTVASSMWTQKHAGLGHDKWEYSSCLCQVQVTLFLYEQYDQSFPLLLVLNWGDWSRHVVGSIHCPLLFDLIFLSYKVGLQGP